MNEVGAVFREEWGRAVSILIRVLGDFELAEDAVQDAFTTALERWPRDGVPRQPVFNEGYSASAGDEAVRGELCDEAIRLTKLLAVLMPDEAEALGLLALMLLHDARREARVAADGEIVLLKDQDRSLWDTARIEEGRQVLERALSLRTPGSYQLQAAIASLHVEAPSAEETDWTQIAALYTELLHLQPSPVVELSRAVAVAMAVGPEAGLALIDRIDLPEYHLLHAARADLLRRLDRREDAADAYRSALALPMNDGERASSWNAGSPTWR